jgi:formamidopyrimidine-DNA glycosylase
MPELPEVETIVRGLNGFLPGKTVAAVDVRHEKVAARHGVAAFKRLLAGETFARVERRGKFLHFRFASGQSLIAHLRMTGKFIVSPGGAVPEDAHLRLVLRLRDGSALLYKDLRIFGSFHIYRAGEEVMEFRDLGRDPVKEKLAADWFRDQCRGRSIGIKVLLLDQKVICGIGNIYACEALFRSRIDPFLPARELTLAQAGILLKNVRSLLLLAIRRNGTSVRDFRNVDDESGGFQRLLKVYGREGEPCPACGTPVERVKQAQRSTYYCPRCQS